MEDEEYHEKYQILKDQLIEGRKMTLEKLRKTNNEIIKANSDYGQKSMRLSSNTFEANGRRPEGRLSNGIYQEQLASLKNERNEKENEVIRPGFQQRVKGFIKEEFEDTPERVDQLERDLAEDTDLQWLKDPNEKEVDKELDEWDKLDEFPEEEVYEGFPGDDDDDGKQTQQINQNTIDLQSEFPGVEVEAPDGPNNNQPGQNLSNSPPKKSGPDIEPS